MRGALGEEKGGVIDPPSYDLQIYERKYEKDMGGFEMEETSAADPARPAPPHEGAGGGFKRSAHSAGPCP